jgi:hypothetical protein
MGIGDRNRILAARIGEDSVTERTRSNEVTEDALDSWEVIEYGNARA